MKRILYLPLAALVLLCGTAQASPNLVTNGSFEQGTLGIGSFQGWQTMLGDTSTYVDSSGKTGPLYGQAFNGLWAAYFGTTAADGGSSISQNLTTVPQTTYVLSFELANDNGGSTASNSFVASLGGTPVLSFTNLANQPYVYEQVLFVASSGSTVLSFSGFNDQSYLELDNVSFSAVPEPSALALLLAGVFVLAITLRGRLRAQPKASV
jgi:hypothetical protein